jgi:ATP phosphoribosyltransferase regulatory subunit
VLDRKDEGGIAKPLGTQESRRPFVGPLRAAGPAERGIAKLIALKLPAAAAAEAARLAEVVKLVRLAVS